MSKNKAVKDIKIKAIASSFGYNYPIERANVQKSFECCVWKTEFFLSLKINPLLPLQNSLLFLNFAAVCKLA